MVVKSQSQKDKLNENVGTTRTIRNGAIMRDVKRNRDVKVIKEISFVKVLNIKYGIFTVSIKGRIFQVDYTDIK